MLYEEDEKGGPTTTAGSKDKTYVEVLLGVFHTNQSRESAEEDKEKAQKKMIKGRNSECIFSSVYDDHTLTIQCLHIVTAETRPVTI